MRIVEQTPRVKSYFLKIPEWHGFAAGQHLDVRLTAPDGYRAQRSYSIGSAPEDGEVELVIERLEEGEVSAFFHEIVEVGDTVEVRGPIGGHFTWSKRDGGPIVLVGGGLAWCRWSRSSATGRTWRRRCRRCWSTRRAPWR